MDLEVQVLKKETGLDILKLMALETLRNKYPQENWLHIYPDGSQI